MSLITRNPVFHLSVILIATLFVPVEQAQADFIIDLVHEFDGDSPGGTTSFGTVELTQNGGFIDFEIIDNTTNLVGGDIHQFYFNLPDAIDISSLIVSNSGGVSNLAIMNFTTMGAGPPVAGGTGASFDTGISFGNGGGPPGNGLLTTATFSLTATGGLLVSDLLSEFSSPNNTPDVLVAVHFQSADVFGNGSETVGGGTVIPEPNSVAVIVIMGMALLQRRSRKLIAL